MLTIEHLVSKLMLPEKCNNTARELFRRKNDYPEIALHLWRSPTTIKTLIMKIQSIYGMLSPPTLTQSALTQICNILNLFQCVVSCPYTRTSSYMLEYLAICAHFSIQETQHHHLSTFDFRALEF